MKNLEDKIIKKVYLYETKRTSFEILLKVVVIVIAFILGLLFGTGFINQLREQETFDLLQIFQEDTDIIKQHISSITYVFYVELPKKSLLVILISLTILAVSILTLVINYDKIKNRIQALISFWSKQKRNL